MIQVSFFPTYLVDTCCLMSLDGRNKVLPGQPPPEPTYSEGDRDLTWQGLEALADDGRLKLIKEVKEELERRHPEALARLAAFPRTKMPPKGNDLRRRYQELTAKYQELIPEEDLVYDPADAWLVVAAQKYGYTLVTDELASDVRKTRARHGPPIPDLCRWECVPCMSLRELANHHGWI